MGTPLLDSFPIYSVYFAIVLFILLSFEVGYQIGKHAQMRSDKEAPGALGPMVGGILSMLAFVLAFTFSMNASQHGLRKQNVLDEANAISTAYLRADLIDEQHGTEIKSLLRDYVDVRVGANNENIDAVIAKSIELHKLLWAQATSVAITTPGANTSLLIQSINNVIDMHEKRVSGALVNRMPAVIRLAVLIIAALTMITLGTQAGYSGSRRLVAVIPLALAFAALATVIVDLDRPQRGIIKVDQQAMISLQKNMNRSIK